jgi:acyl-coenzyme A thioesterase PaaI-like protein
LSLGTLNHGDRCFGCGPSHPCGLRLRHERAGDRIRARFAFRPEHEGPPGRAHGGLVALALDDAMSIPLHSTGVFAVTARIELDLRAAAPVGEELLVEAWIAARDGRKAQLRSKLRDGERVLAEATAVYVEMDAPSALRHDSQSPTTGK